MAAHDLHVAPDGENWVVHGETELSKVRTYPNKIAALSAARQMMRNTGEGSVTVHRRDGRIESEETISSKLGTTRQTFPLRHDQSPGQSDVSSSASPDVRSRGEGHLLEELSSKTGESPDDVINKALALFKAATEAVEQGKSVGIASDPSHLEAEFVGF